MSDKLRIYHLLADNPSWLQIIKEAFEAEKKYYKRYPKEQYPNMEWLGFEWHQVHGRPATLNKMVANRILDVSYSSHSATNYMVANPELVKEVIAMLESGAEEQFEEAEIPDDAFQSITGYDDIPLAQYSHPTLTTVRQPIYRIASDLCRTLVHITRGEQAGKKEILIEPKLIVRESSGARRVQ